MFISLIDGQAIALRLSRQIDNTVKKIKNLIETHNETALSPLTYEEAINVEASCYSLSDNVILLNNSSKNNFLLYNIHSLYNKFTIFII